MMQKEQALLKLFYLLSLLKTLKKLRPIIPKIIILFKLFLKFKPKTFSYLFQFLQKTLYF